MRPCAKCGEQPRSSYHHWCKKCHREYSQNWRKTRLSPEKAKWYRRTEDIPGQYRRRAERRKAIKLEMIAAYGGKCVCCGETRWQFLTLEHTGKRGSGRAERLKFGKTSIMYCDLKRRGWPKKGYSCLCFNCNSAKGMYRVCPHQEELLSPVPQAAEKQHSC